MNYLQRLLRRAALDYQHCVNPIGHDPFEIVEDDVLEWPKTEKPAEIENNTQVINKNVLSKNKNSDDNKHDTHSIETVVHEVKNTEPSIEKFEKHKKPSGPEKNIEGSKIEPLGKLVKTFLNDRKVSIVDEIMKSVVEPESSENHLNKEQKKKTVDVDPVADKEESITKTLKSKKIVQQLLPPKEEVQYIEKNTKKINKITRHEVQQEELNSQKNTEQANNNYKNIQQTSTSKLIVVNNNSSSLSKDKDEGGCAPYIGIGQL